MASSSTSSVPKSFKYDVFLSFRGEDTRTNFIDHLYSALEVQSVYTYKDDERIKKGKRIDDELMTSIEDSRLFIIVFSKNYVSSSWCLDELVKIMECRKESDHTAYPVFYDVEPTEIRNQTGAVGEAFVRHEKKEAAGKWRKALKEVSDLAGWELKKTDDGHEAKFIKRIVEEVSLELRSINFFIDEKLVGMETRINDIVSSLGNAINDVHMIGIWGMGGGGKTTLATTVYNKMAFQFEGKSFIDNVREVSCPSLSGVKLLQKQVLSDVLNNQGINVGSVNEGKSMMSRMIRGRKVLLVLDDVDHINQLQALAGDRSWFKPGSVVIITTREKQVLVAHGVKIHTVNLLSHEEALCLFTRYAFGREIPKGYEELSRQVIHYAAGLPLTLKVLGSSLCGKCKPEWKDALARLENIPDKEIQEQLEVSYTGLDNEQKEMFLDLATILKGWSKDSAIQALESCGFYAVYGLKVLELKSLMNFYSYSDNVERVGMHDQLQEMGRNIVRRDMPHSRLSDSMEIEDILATNQGTEATRYINFRYEGQNREIIMQGLRKMKKLQFLHVTMDFYYSKQEADKLTYFPDALRYLCWKGYPFTSLPKRFKANNLVSLEMVDTNLVQLWEGGEKKVLNKLRFLYLKGYRLRPLDLGLTPNLETLRIEEESCDWVEIRMPVECPKLRSLHLLRVKSTTIDIGLTPNLKELHLVGCHHLQELHMGDGCVKLTYLRLLGNHVKTLDLGRTPNLERLDLRYCHDLEELHIAECPILTDIHVGNCSKLRSLDLRPAPNLSTLSLLECEGLVDLHLPNECLNLTSLKITKSKLRSLVLGLTLTLMLLEVESYDLKELHLADNCQELLYLNISHSKLRTLDLGHAPNIKELDLGNCCYLEELHMASECQKLPLVILLAFQS